MEMKMVAKTFKGLEEILAEELIGLGANNIELKNRAVDFTGDKRVLYKANLHLRTASRVLVPIASFRAKDTDELYEQVRKINWQQYMHVESSFSIDSTVYSDLFRNSRFVTYRVKDAVVDYFFEKERKRPDVELSEPDLTINVHIAQNRVTISLDSSGESLHKRGYRVTQNEAPISEALAAGMILMTGWRGESDFVDPMCGSGTLLIEAAMIALNIPPGIFRSSFAFEKWLDFDDALFQELYNDESGERDFTHKIYGSDISEKAVQVARQNVQSAGLNKYIEVSQQAVEVLERNENKALLVCNPPYGERIVSEDIFGLYSELGSYLKHRFNGDKAWVISSDMKALRKIGLKPSKRIPLLNGPLDCFYCSYEIFDGKRSDFLRDRFGDTAG